ncbi:MAG: hypothetical protein Q9187_008121 [Circinaria calcarea]
MNQHASFCDACHSIAREIQDHFQDIKANPSYSIRRHVSELEPYKVIKLGVLEDLQSRRQCTSCQAIACKLVQDGNRLSANTVLIFESRQQQGLYILSEFGMGQDYLQLWPMEDPIVGYEVGRIFDAQQVNIDLMRQWINCCHVSHGDSCMRSELPFPSHQIYLIDVEEGCLVPIKAETRYIALSYVWGGAAIVQTTKSSLAHLKKPRSITADIGSLKIADTIRDALQLVSLLGERYLWVDSLCIVQDELDTKQLHLNSMASIYSNAYFTIVAANGHDANYGLRGIGGGTQDRKVRCDIVQFPCGINMTLHHPRAWYPADSTWEARAWTFQEALFSRRILIINGLVSWYCRTVLWQEHVNSPTEDVMYAVTHKPLPHKLYLAASNPTWPDLSEWQEMVEEFNKRKLTYDKDVIDAFLGVTSVFNCRFNGGILWGIPEMFFDHCIIWAPQKVLRRRGAHSHLLSDNALPSWSWVGWEGEIVLLGAPLIYDNDPASDDQTVEIQPVVQWYKSSNPTSTLLPVKNTYHFSQLTYANKQPEELPNGWARDLYPDGTAYYTHDTVPSVRFRYLVPLANKDVNPLQNDQGRYLHFETQRARLFVGQEVSNIHDDWTTLPACLVDEEENWAGIIRFNIPRYDPSIKGQPCELIALSLASAANSGDYGHILEEWEMPERPCDSEYYRFYYVMWIEWENGIAYRKAIGTVYKPMWEKQVRENIHVVLG